MIRRSALSFSTFFLCSLASPAFAGHVFVVDAGGSGSYLQIQDAVDAAADGDTILVKAGNYSAFAIQDKGLSVVGDMGASVHVVGRVRVDDLAAAKTVFFAYLQIQPPGSQPAGSAAFTATHASGAIRIEQCAIHGADSTTGTSNAQLGVILYGDSDAAFANCTIEGGLGGWPGFFGLDGEPGAHAILATSCRVALHECVLRGGTGSDGLANPSGLGDPGGSGGRGGASYRLDDGFLFVDDSQLSGGDGGRGGDSAPCCFLCGGPPGDGGPGGHCLLAVDPAPPHPNLTFLGNFMYPGSGGPPGINYNNYCWSNGAPGADGSAVVAPPGCARHISGPPRRLDAPRVVRENTTVSWVFHGQPGDRVWVYVARSPDFVINVPFHGVNLTELPPHARLWSFGTIQAGGAMTVSVQMPDLGVDSTRFFVQPVFRDGLSRRFLGTPVTIVDLDSAY